MYANMSISISKSLWQAMSLDAREEVQGILNGFMGGISSEIERLDKPLPEISGIITFSASAVDDKEEEVV